jgi:uncharacterized SAM-binding protein YcdF (DUF218 family)
MFFYASKIIAALIWPSSVITMMILVGAAGLVTGRFVRVGRRLLVTGIALLLACGVGPVGSMLILPLEQRFAREALPADVAGVIMLGGFENGALANARGELSLNDSAERLTEGIRLALLRPKAKLVFTGGDGSLSGGGRHGAAPSVGDYLADVGIARGRIVLEGVSRTTWENALFLHDMLKPQPGQKFVLVTSAFHMPRSVGTFERVGFEVHPWPVDYRSRGILDVLRPSTSIPDGLEKVDTAFKEWVGLVAYRLSGRSVALWPSRTPVAATQGRPPLGSAQR